MRIERLEIDGFGRFHQAAWDLPEGLTVLVGANEAGKTTLLNALRALLFGFESTRDGRTWYPALAGGRRGGRLVLRTSAGERWTVERHGERGGGGAIAVRAPNGNQGGQETLDRLLHGADRDLFNNVFAFGLGELQALSSLSADGVRGRIYGAGAGLGGTSALDLERRLRQGLDAAFLPRGSQRPLNQLLLRIEELRAEVAELARQPEEHAAAHAEREALCRRSEQVRGELTAVRESLERARRLRQAGPVAASLVALEADLAAGDATLDAMPADAVAVLDRRLAELESARAVLSTIDESIAEARRVRAGLAIDETVLAMADDVAAVAEERGRRSASADRRRDLLAGAARAEAALAEQMARAGGWAEERLLTLDDSIPTIEATRVHEAELERTRGSLAEAEARRRGAVDELERRTSEATRHDDGDDADSLADRTAAFRELDALRLAMAAGRRDGRDPRRAWAVALALFVAAAVIGWAAAAPAAGLIAGVALAVAALVMLGGAERPAPEPAMVERRAALLDRVGLPPHADDAAISAAGERLAAARARRELAESGTERVAAVRQDLERRERDLQDARSAAETARTVWHAWLNQRGLPHDASPEAVRHLLAAAGIARRAAGERDHHRRELAALDADDAAYRARVDRLLERAGLDGPQDDDERRTRVAALVERRDRAIADARRARELDEQIERLLAKRAPAAAKLAERETALAAQLASLGCADVDEVRRRDAAAAERRSLRAAIREERRHLAGIAGGPEGIDALLAELRGVDPAQVATLEAEARATLDRLEAEEREAQHRIGALSARIRELETTEELGTRRQELAVLEGRAAALARDWAVRALALRLLEETRARYERERQPDVVRAAESHFARITGGRYARIVAPPGDAAVRVETEGGESRTTDELSRGTGEQLYLALRFGLIEEFARQAEALPVVMDDILVNFDAERAARAAAAIRELAERHQVLYFTCHAPTAELLDPDRSRTVTLG